MFNSIRKYWNGALSLTMAAFVAAAIGPNDAEAKEFRFVHAYPTASQHNRNVEWFTQEVTKRSNGEITFKVFPAAQLMPINQELPAILSGQISMTYSIAPIVASVEPLWGIFDLPLFFDVKPDDIGHGKRFFDSPDGGGVLAAAMEKRGFKLVSIAPTDFSSSIYLTKAKAPKTLEDVQGLKIRAPGGKVAAMTGEALGYSPIAIAGAELVPALSQGVVDGAILPPIYTYDNKLPLKGLSIAPFSWTGVTPIIMSLKEFNELTPDQQKLMMDVGTELADRAVKTVEEQAAADIEKLKEGGADVSFLSDEEIVRWREKAKPVWDAWVKDNGDLAKQMLDAGNELR